MSISGRLKLMKKYIFTIIAGIICGLAFCGMVFLVKNIFDKEANNKNQEGIAKDLVIENKQEVVKEEPLKEVAVEEATNEAPKSEISENSDLNAEKDDAENSENKFKFAVLGDTQYFKIENKAGAFQRAVAKIKDQNVSLLISDGDIISDCDDECAEKIKNWKTVLGALAEKTYVAIGNHDRTDGNKHDKIFQDSFVFPTNGPNGYSELVYSFDYKNSHFVFLDTEKPEEHSIVNDQRSWLEKDLAATKKENKFVFFHEPAYPLSDKIGESLDVKEKDRDALWAILNKYNVAAVFNGHEHIQSRRKVDNILQFVFGNTDSFSHELPKTGADFSYKGQAFGIVEVDGKNIKVKTISVDGKLLDDFSFSK